MPAVIEQSDTVYLSVPLRAGPYELLDGLAKASSFNFAKSLGHQTKRRCSKAALAKSQKCVHEYIAAVQR